MAIAGTAAMRPTQPAFTSAAMPRAAAASQTPTKWVRSSGMPTVRFWLNHSMVQPTASTGAAMPIQLHKLLELMPPLWSFGFWQSRISYQSADEALEVVRGNREAGTPTDVLHLDTHWFRESWRCDLALDPDAALAARG